MKDLKFILLSIVLLACVGVHAQVKKNIPSIQYEIYDSSYNFQGLGFTFSTINVLSRIGFGFPENFHSASFGAVDMATGSKLWQKTLTEDTINGRSSYCLAFNHYQDNTASIRWNDYDADGYYIFDENMDTILNLSDLGINPDNHGIAKLQDGRYAYFQDTIQLVNFYSNEVPDSTDWDALAFDIYIFDPTDSSRVKIFDWFSSVDSSFLVPEYLYEGDFTGSEIDWSHPNSIFEDYDGNVLVSWRHSGVCKVDINTGQVLWWLGLPTGMAAQQGFNEPTCVSGDCRIRLQHDLRPIPGMPNHYTLFDNGDTARDYSRALFFSIDTLNNTMQIEKDPQFLRSDFMGSLALMEDGSYLVNVPTIQKLPYEKVPNWIANGVFEDSIANYIYLLGSDMFLMDANDQVIAKFWSDSANFVYNNFIVDFSNWPGLTCNEDSILSSSYPSSFNWENSQQVDLGTNEQILADESIVRISFPYGVFKGYSSYFDSKTCLSTSIEQLALTDFYLFPNPSQKTLFFSDEVEDFQIYDLLGSLLQTGKGQYADVSALNKGVYFITVSKDGKRGSLKFSKN